MNQKTMTQICIPFLTAVGVIVVFYVLGVVFGSILFDAIFNWDFGEELMNFFFLFSDYSYTSGWVVGGILWVLSTVYLEMIVSED